MVPILILYLVIGLYPKPFLSRMEPSVNFTLDLMRGADRRVIVEKYLGPTDAVDALLAEAQKAGKPVGEATE